MIDPDEMPGDEPLVTFDGFMGAVSNALAGLGVFAFAVSLCLFFGWL